MLDMLHTFCDLLSALVEDVGKEGEVGVVTLVKWEEFSIRGHYQSKVRLHMLNLHSQVALLDMVLCMAECACKKVRVYVQ